MRFRHVLRAAAALGALAIASACGTTVPLAERRRHNNKGSRPAPPARKASAAFRLDGSGDPGWHDRRPDGTVSGGTSGGPVPAPRQLGGTAQPAAGGTTAGGGAVGPGVDRHGDLRGLAVAVNSGAANAAIGAAGITTGDSKRETRRSSTTSTRTAASPAASSCRCGTSSTATSTAPTATLYQEMCDDWTQDHKVFVGFAGGDEDDAAVPAQTWRARAAGRPHQLADEPRSGATRTTSRSAA